MLKSEKTFPFAWSNNGTIRADDVPPGTYKLSIELGNAINQWNAYLAPIGSLEEEVVVPVAEDQSVPVDLGELTVPRAKAEDGR